MAKCLWESDHEFREVVLHVARSGIADAKIPILPGVFVTGELAGVETLTRPTVLFPSAQPLGSKSGHKTPAPACRRRRTPDVSELSRSIDFIAPGRPHH